MRKNSAILKPMAENIQPSLEHSALERDIQELAKEVKEKGLSDQGRQALQTVLKERVAATPSVPVAPSPAPAQPAQPSPNLPDYTKSEPADVKLKIEKLLDLAWHKGVKHAAKEAAIAGPLVLDAFHDALIDKLYPEFKKRGLLR